MFTRQVFAASGRCIVLTGWAIVAAIFGGCGGGDRGPERVVVSGTVTYNGKPVSEGMIRFVPDEKSPVPSAGAPITDGKYKVDGHGGVPIGTFQIQIEAFRIPATPLANRARAMPPIGGAAERQQYLPEKYNVSTKLELTIQPGSRAITKNFDLTD